MSEDVEKRYTWRAVGLNGHREVFGSEFLYTSEDAPVEADEYVRAMERADRLLVERDAAIKRAEAAEADAKAQRNAKDIAIARNGELHQELHAMCQRAEAAEAKLALVDTFAEWKRNAPHGSLTFEQWLAGREAAGYPTITARIGQTIIRPEFPVDPADYE